ncbi:hypothetical protein Tfer_3189 [Thermincola ferriacetica]|uniref:Lipoprotein n=1 Tax=Thermincola ferriacetica TaxID=281456 RepID=A0A0L6VYL7_9FIRM|nr:hypothetical protein [Thermincola ferriacetica]KNZ68263.1 hypothetical protein Tfer_3189 [Thermincola ferriacetica]
MRKSLQALLFLAICISLLLGGCTYRSGPKKLGVEEEGTQEYSVNPRASAIIRKAITTTEQRGQKFWFNGWIVNKIQKRKTTSMYDGTYVRGKGYLVNARVLGQQFRYYRWGKEAYMSKEEEWVKAPPAQEPPDPFAGFSRIKPYANKARQLPDEKVLDRECYVLEINLTGQEVQNIFGSLRPASEKPLENLLLDRLEMKYRLWIGKKDNYIYQIKTETVMPVPQAGSMYHEVYFRFWDYNSKSITLPKPENITKYLKK